MRGVRASRKKADGWTMWAVSGERSGWSLRGSEARRLGGEEGRTMRPRPTTAQQSPSLRGVAWSRARRPKRAYVKRTCRGAKDERRGREKQPEYDGKS